MALYKKLILCIALLFSSLFIGVGYAELTQSFTVYGSIYGEPPKAVYITDVIITEGDKSDPLQSNIEFFSTTLVSSKVVLGNNKNATINMQITVFNNTDITYGFSAIKYAIGNSTYDNENIGVRLLDLEIRDPLNAKESLIFNVQFYYTSNDTSNVELNSLIQYEFLPLTEIPEDSGEIAANDATEQFINILNDPEQFNLVIEQLEDYENQDRLNSSYIGNLSGSSEADLKLIEELFDGKLLININGVITEVTLMIKREDLDNNNSTGDEEGREMAIYMTTESLDTAFRRVTVYASAYTKVATMEKWEQIGTLVEGDARVNGYDGNYFGTGSFNTDSWKSVDGETIEEIVRKYK